MSEMLNYIPDDGYTEKAYIGAKPGFYGEFRFEYRPMLIEERGPLFAAAGKMPSDAYSRKCAAEVAKKLRSWSLVDAKGQPVPVSAANILRLKPTLHDRLFEIVLGLATSDTDPQWDDDHKDAAAEAQYESALTGKSPAEQLEEGALGN